MPSPWGFSLWEFEIYGNLTQWGGNVAKGQPALASSIEGNEFAAGRAVDGFSATRWASAWVDDQYIVVGLGGLTWLKRVILKWETAYASRYRVQVGDGPAGPWRAPSGGPAAAMDHWDP